VLAEKPVRMSGVPSPEGQHAYVVPIASLQGHLNGIWGMAMTVICPAGMPQ
jgi:hypothetical protein